MDVVAVVPPNNVAEFSFNQISGDKIQVIKDLGWDKTMIRVLGFHRAGSKKL